MLFKLRPLLTFGLLLFFLDPAYGASADGDYIGSPIIIPVWPEGVSRCSEGWVRLKFDLDNTGAVVKIRITEADPAGIFDKAAVATVQRFMLPKLAGKKGIKYIVRYSPLDTCNK